MTVRMSIYTQARHFQLNYMYFRAGHRWPAVKPSPCSGRVGDGGFGASVGLQLLYQEYLRAVLPSSSPPSVSSYMGLSPSISLGVTLAIVVPAKWFTTGR